MRKRSEGACRGRRRDELRPARRNVPERHPATKGATCSAPRRRLGCTTRAHLSRHAMTDASAQDEWDPGRRKDAARPRTDRRRLGWREFRRNYPRLRRHARASPSWCSSRSTSCCSRAISAISSETRELRASMTDVERKRTDEILAQNENRLKVMVELFKRQAKVDPSLHLSVSLDSSVMYLEREGALLREMPITVGPERRVGTPPDTVHIAAPRGKRTVERLLGERMLGRTGVGVCRSRHPGGRDAARRARSGRRRSGSRRDGDLLAAARRSAQRLELRAARRDPRARDRPQGDRTEPPPGVAVYFY